MRFRLKNYSQSVTVKSYFSTIKLNPQIDGMDIHSTKNKMLENDSLVASNSNIHQLDPFKSLEKHSDLITWNGILQNLFKKKSFPFLESSVPKLQSSLRDRQSIHSILLFKKLGRTKNDTALTSNEISILLGYLSEHRQPYLALRLLKLMLMNPVFQNTTLTINDHHVILLIYSKCHQLESIKDHIQLMVSLNMKPDVKTFNILLFNLLKQKNLDEFNYVWEQFNQIWPGLIFLNAEIWCFAIELNGKLNRLDEAIELYQKLDTHYKLNRLPFPVIVKEAMIKAYGHNNRPQEAIQVFESIPFSVTDLHLPHSGGFETIDAIIESCLASDSPFLAIDYWNFGMTLCSELDQLSGLGKRDVSYSIPWLEKKDQRYYQLKKFTYLLPQTYARMMSYYYNIRDYKQVIHLFNDHFHTMQTTRTAFEILCWTYLAQGDTLMANKSNFEMIQLYYPPSKILQTEITKMRKQFRTNKGLKNHQGKSMRLQGVLDIVKDQQLDLKTLKNVNTL